VENENPTQVEEVKEGTEPQKPETPSKLETTETQQPETEQKTPETKPETKPKEEKIESKKTYTAEEVAKIQSEAMKEAAQVRQHLAQLSMQQEIARLQQEEAAAQKKDKASVEAGEITQEDADTKAQARQEMTRLQRTVRQLAPQAEQLGRIQMANDLASEYGISADELIKDQSIQNPLQMTQKAAKLAIAKLKEEVRKVKVKPETFDKGPGTGDAQSAELTPEQIEKMSMEEYANHPSVKKRFK